MVYHKALAAGAWQKLTLAEQLGNIGSEVHRAHAWRIKDAAVAQNSIYRALELLDLTIQDMRWLDGLRELVRIREFLCTLLYEERTYGMNLEDLNDYFFQFALAAQLKK